jgi:hypothetical protein
MAPGSKDKTAFSVEGLGNFSFKKLTMGISAASWVFPACHGHGSQVPGTGNSSGIFGRRFGLFQESPGNGGQISLSL